MILFDGSKKLLTLAVLAGLFLSACGQADETTNTSANLTQTSASSIPSSGPMTQSPSATTSSSVITAAITELSPTQLSALIGSWQGSLVKGRDEFSLAFTFSQDQQGQYKAALFSAAMNMYGLPLDSFTFDGGDIVLRSERLEAQFTGTLVSDEAGKLIRIDGDWFQESELVPVTLLPVESPDV